MLAEHFLTDRDIMMSDVLRRHFTAPLQSAARLALASLDAAAATSSTALTPALVTAAERTGFACGVEVLPPIEAIAHSPSLERAAVQRRAAARVEEDAGQQQNRLRRAAELFRELQSARDAAPDMPVVELMRHASLGGADGLSRELFLAQADAAPADVFLAACGNGVVEFSGAENVLPRQIALPDTLGPIRSVTATRIEDAVRWLIGARGGVMVVDPDRPAEAHLFTITKTDSPLGFNAVAVDSTNGRIVATHSTFGLMTWPLDRAGAPVALLASSSPLRHVTIHQNHLLACRGGTLIRIEDDAILPVVAPNDTADIVALLISSSAVYTVRGDGNVTAYDPVTLAATASYTTGDTVTAAGLVSLLDGDRLLLTTGTAAQVVVVDARTGDLVQAYRSADRGLRSLAGGPGHIAALAGDRQRVLLWKSSSPRTPPSVVNLFALTGHRAADLKRA